MKKTILSVLLGLAFTFGFSQTATNFTANDCAGNSHTLFNELDGGQVIVVAFVMPCGSCIGPSQTAYTTSQSFASSNPGRVSFYIVDDVANTSCSTLNSWATTNSMPNSTKFSTISFTMSDYGTAGMPKIVVLGGTNHAIFYNANNTVSASAIQTAITNALNATTGITESEGDFSSLNLFPNPANNYSEISYSLSSSSEVKISIYNMLGDNTGTVFTGTQCAGEHKFNTDCTKLQNGIYFIKLQAGKAEKTFKLSVTH